MNFQEAEAQKEFIKETIKTTLLQDSPFLFYNATVTALNGDFASVILYGDTTDIPDVINKTKEILSIGDRVVLMAKNGKLGDCVIHVRWENDVT